MNLEDHFEPLSGPYKVMAPLYPEQLVREKPDRKRQPYESSGSEEHFERLLLSGLFTRAQKVGVAVQQQKDARTGRHRQQAEQLRAEIVDSVVTVADTLVCGLVAVLLVRQH